MKRKLVAIVLILIIAVNLSSCEYVKRRFIGYAEGEPPAKYAEMSHLRTTYAYDNLPDHLKPEYNTLLKAMLNFCTKTRLNVRNEQEVEEIFIGVLNDNPLIIWTCESMEYKKMLFDDRYYITIDFAEDRDAANLRLAELQANMQIMLSDIDPNLSEAEKATIVFEKLVSEVTYDNQEIDQSNPYGAIVRKRATCEGYATAYQILLLELGIESILVLGDAGNPPGGHAWNIVKIDGKYYYSDPTFGDASADDEATFISYKYLFATGEDMQKTHFPKKEVMKYPLPECTADEAVYFMKNDLYFETADYRAVEKRLQSSIKEVTSRKLPALQIQFAEEQAFKDFWISAVDNEMIIRSILVMLEDYENVRFVGTIKDTDDHIITFLLKYI